MSFTCRQCGALGNDSDINNGIFRCQACGWRELRGGGRSAKGAKPPAKAKPAPPPPPPPPPPVEAIPEPVPEDEFAAAPQPLAWGDHEVATLRTMDRTEFAQWCAGLLERFGYRTRVLCDGDDDECFDVDLVAERGGQVVLVDCIPFTEHQSVGRLECQRLVGALLGAGCGRAIIVGCGDFDPGAQEYVDRVDGVEVEFVDADRLEHTLHEMREGPLRVWWGREAA